MTDESIPPHVTVFSLGGTIAGTPAPGGGVAPGLGAAELIDGVPGLARVATLETVAFRRVPSSDLTLADIIALAHEVGARLASGATGVVVTQGTDTIEETAFALEVLLGSRGPVVVTGAMRNPTLAGPDGPANLLAAVQVAAGAASRLGTVVVFNDEIHAARFVRKTHTSSPSTFRSAPVGPVGWVVEGRARVAWTPEPLTAPLAQALVPGSVPPAVALLRMSLGDDGRLIEAATSLGYAGAVVEGFGGGHVPARVAPVLQRLAEQMPVVLASRTGSGEVLRETYASPGSEIDLLARGLIGAGHLDGAKARVLLRLALAAGEDKDAIVRRFAAL